MVKDHKDHKDNFPHSVSCRSIIPSKADIGKTVKQYSVKLTFS